MCASLSMRADCPRTGGTKAQGMPSAWDWQGVAQLVVGWGVTPLGVGAMSRPGSAQPGAFWRHAIVNGETGRQFVVGGRRAAPPHEDFQGNEPAEIAGGRGLGYPGSRYVLAEGEPSPRHDPAEDELIPRPE